MRAYDKLLEYTRDTTALGLIAGRLGWDQETMMPAGAAVQRSAEMAAIEGVLHARRSSSQVGDWLAEAEAAHPTDPVARAQLREIRRAYDRATRVPGDLAAALARLTSQAHGLWARARADEDVASYLPVLTEIVALKRQEGQALADEGADAYDAMVQDYEPGITGAEIAALFDAMRPRLVALRSAILDQPAPDGVAGTFDEGAQIALSNTLAKTFGYDFARGRVDKAVHPFSSGSGADVRITTRTSATDPFNCIYSTIHEVGHAAYEQGIDPDFMLTPLGCGVSMGVHESQSRIYENQIGRSRAFTAWLFGQMRETFGEFGIDDPDAFYSAVNRVNRGYIRTEADEVQYNLHIMLRFDLERALIAGDLQPTDLEAAWNDRFAADFGYGVDKPSNGCLQDVHWSGGLFGYFPTYSLGNVYAGCLHVALRDAVPDLDSQLEAGNTAPATTWLRENLQRHGGLFQPRETIEKASGMPVSERYLLDYLDTKFKALYDL